MSVTIRLSRYGRKKLPFYRIVAADKQQKRDGRYLELLGTLNPLTDPATVTLKEDRVKYWVGMGAQTSDTVAQIIEKQIPGFLGDIDTKKRAKIKAARSKRKARSKGKAAPKKSEKKTEKKKAKTAKAAKK